MFSEQLKALLFFTRRTILSNVWPNLKSSVNSYIVYSSLVAITYRKAMAVAARSWRLIGSSPSIDYSLTILDIGSNLTDAMFLGQYYGKQVHPPDLDHVLQRFVR